MGWGGPRLRSRAAAAAAAARSERRRSMLFLRCGYSGASKGSSRIVGWLGSFRIELLCRVETKAHDGRPAAMAGIVGPGIWEGGGELTHSFGISIPV